jgi:RNA-splicing ligase RtcB
MSDIKIFTKNIEDKASNQVYKLAKLEPFKNAKIRIMPDVHAGAGCVIGFTANLGDKIIPNVVGVDIGCGMLTIELGNVDIDLEKLDNIINEYIPSGFNVHEYEQPMPFNLCDLECADYLKNFSRLKQAIGSLGGGNHFIEIDVDDENNKYLIIHSGSRNLGHQVATYYQKLAIKYHNEVNQEQRNELIQGLKKQNRQRDISKEIKKLKPLNPLPKHLCYLEGYYREEYLHDMRLCQDYASHNRWAIADSILHKMELKGISVFQTIHNYIGDDNIIRKGAISAYKDEKVLIPINMRDGCIIAIGKGNEDWNYSAPHGAGRIMARGVAKRTLDMQEFKDTMKGVYSTSIVESTLDEAPMAYKPMQEILDNIKDTVEVVKIIKPIYNFKAK